MLQAATANWNPSAEGYVRASTNANFERSMAAMQDSIAVSASQPLALVEQDAPQQVAFATQPSFKTSSSEAVADQSLYSADTAMMAVAMIGAWMMVVGGAMLSRKMRFVQQEDSATQH